MTVMHHPTDEALAEFAAGTLNEGRSLLIATHLAHCAHCREAISLFEHVGGALLDSVEPVAMLTDAPARALAMTETAGETPFVPPSRKLTPEGLPALLAHYKLGRWIMIGRGVYWRSVTVPESEKTKTFMLKARPGTRLPHHSHEGDEWTCILQGAFSHGHGCYGPGDFDVADETVDHRPVIEDGEDCICLVALDGRLKFEGVIGRVIQSLVRI